MRDLLNPERHPPSLKLDLLTVERHRLSLKPDLRFLKPHVPKVNLQPPYVTPFDPNLPQENTSVDAVQMRAQFTGRKDIIDALNTLDLGKPTAVSVNFDGSNVRFTFGIPRGNDGGEGQQGIQGPPGEVTNATLANAISGTSSNTNAVSTLGLAVSDPPTQGEMQTIVNKIDELILALRN